ncbi:hypothetical protein ACH5RR_022564 [Cinchona calisaya]|uniref:ATP-dependent DNA helicase n=1 Tax=Cinchona calisaya TaxID=153742 RepID=A0ABD2ZBB4_9GENT
MTAKQIQGEIHALSCTIFPFYFLGVHIPAASLSASMKWTEHQEILREINPQYCKYKLLYVTPRVVRSDELLTKLESLSHRGWLTRIVIDEAHCISHDQGLEILKKKFPKVPVLALTATATVRVQEDVVKALDLVNCIVFKQSFNRPNLRYSVVPKTSNCDNDIVDFIKANHLDDCGIIYCMSNTNCEKIAEKLQECGLQAASYYGASTQEQWIMDDFKIICATDVFGTGINKPNVRFVIHQSLPKSIENYCQECGRAGRDGQPASCVLFYRYNDYIELKHILSRGMVDQSYGHIQATTRTGRILETCLDSLQEMVSYCENDVDCRRHLQLIHFGEEFNSANCQKTCDNCSKAQRIPGSSIDGGTPTSLVGSTVDNKYDRDFVEYEKLGEGSCGTVYKCRSRFDGLTYAIKKIAFMDCDTQMVVEEVRLLCKAQHEHVVRYYQAWIEDAPPSSHSSSVVSGSKILYILMEPCKQTLEKTVKDERLSSRTALAYFREIVEALVFLHDKHIIHYDLKLSNVFVDATGTLKIGDFGLATVVDTEREVGLIAAKFDIYSLGMILFDLYHPISDELRNDALLKLQDGDFPPDWCLELKHAISKLILWLLEANAYDRPSASEVLHFIDRFRNGS